MPTVLGPIPWKVLTKVYREVPVEDLFLKKTLIPPTNVEKLLTETVTYRIVKEPMSVATMGLPGDPPKQVNIAQKVVEESRNVLQIFEEDMVTTSQLLYDWRMEQLDQGLLNSENDIVQSLHAIYTPKLAEMKKRVERRIELMCAQVLSTGQINYNDGTRTITVDYGIPSAGTIDFTTGEALSEIRDAVETFANDFGMLPNILVMSSDVAKAFLEDPQVEKYINRTTFGWGNLNPRRVSATVHSLGSFPEFMISEIYVYTGYYFDENSQKQSYLPSGKIFMTHTDIWHLAYGAIFDFEVNPNGAPIVTDVLVKETVANRGTAKVITVLSKPLVYITNSYGVRVFDVTMA